MRTVAPRSGTREPRRDGGWVRDGRPAQARPGQGRRRLRARKRVPPRGPPSAAPPKLCLPCGKAPAAPERTACGECLEKRRAADRARYAAGKAAGKPYGGADAAVKRRAGRAKSKRRQKERIEAGLCIRCGKRPPVEGGTTCAPCREKRQAAERRQYAERRAAGCCTRCGGPVHDGLSRCAPCAAIEEAAKCPERKNARTRELYAERRAAGLCTACGAPSQGDARCAPCAKRSYEGSAHFRGMPLYPPSYAVYLHGADEPLAVLDDEMEVAAWLAFEKIGRDQVEIVADAPEIASWAAWS